MSTVSSTSSSLSSSLSSYSTSTSSTSANSSTVDWSGLIEASVQARLSKADTIDTKITANQTKISAYQALQTRLHAISTAAKALANLPGSSNASANVFNERSAYLIANGDATASSVLSVDVDSGTQTGSHDIVINQLAKANKVASATHSSASEALGHSGTFSIGLEDGTSAEISISNSMSLNDVASTINKASSTTGVAASVLKIADGSFELVLTAKETGKDIEASASSGVDVLNELGVTDGEGNFTNVIQAAQNSIIQLDGISITRSSNDISDVIDGMMFHLYSTTADGTSLNVQVAENLTDIQSAINTFVSAYNDLRDFVKTQTATGSDGTAGSDAVLFADSTLRSIDSQIQNQLTTSVSGYSLADLGITFDGDNKLSVDSSVFSQALNNDLSSVASLFQYQMTTSSSNIRLLAQGMNAPSSFVLDVAVDSSGAITSASIDGNGDLFQITGTRIIGKAGTAYEGFSFSFAGSTSESISITQRVGLASKIYASSDEVGNANDGSVELLINNLEDQDTTLKTKSDRIKTNAESYRTALTERYAKIQQAILEANSTISYLKILNNQSSSSN